MAEKAPESSGRAFDTRTIYETIKTLTRYARACIP